MIGNAKIYDPIHHFIPLTDEESFVIDSAPFQRLRYLHQLGMAYLLYPGATHSRFEHSLGVMHLASKVFDGITSFQRYPQGIPAIIPTRAEELFKWKKILRLASLCHDLGHLPFSHSAEHELLSDIAGHEEMSYRIIYSKLMQPVWQEIGVLDSLEALAKLTLGEEKLAKIRADLAFSPWERILSQIITDNKFGVDRVDYLLRDAYYTGVGYGYFDYHQLLETLVILSFENNNFMIGVQKNGVQAIEALLLQRYFMYSRIYEHKKIKLYTMHLKNVMKELYQGIHNWPVEEYIDLTDVEVLAEIAQLAKYSASTELSLHAKAIKKRDCYFDIFEIPTHITTEAEFNQFIEKLFAKWGSSFIKYDAFKPLQLPRPIEILTRMGTTNSAVVYKGSMLTIPHVVKSFLYVAKEISAEVADYLATYT
ncbi:MAG: metal dependent phosphohydrolase [Chlamydiales bacterium]|jgi:HD superfamily phosphohydrolase|nr:metal dependent phosphohydrolase [Chlamydiales bacterium]